MIFYVALLAILAATSSALKDVSEVRYRFTSCGAVGRTGPTLSQCTKWYSDQKSSIVTQNLFFGFSSGGTEMFKGGQGFKVPKSGFYNITVAGAAGGRGICSYKQGLGLLWKGIIKLQDTQDLLILTGQKGAEPCEVLKDVPVCSSVPNNTEASNLCFNDWYSWLNTNPNLSQNDISTAYLLAGGGGGGGASMVRVRDRKTGVFHTVPSVVAGGGGGSGAFMSADIFSDLNIPIHPYLPVNASLDDRYTFFLDAKSADRDLTLVDVHNFTGSRGYIGSSVDIFRNRAGAGGGYFPAVSLHQDGTALNMSENFAVGGYDCLHLSMDVNRRPLIVAIHGGFGGGGGQCESGGSGGGYNGGSIFSNRIFGIPGNGGFSSHFSESSNTVSKLDVDLNAELDGYIEIVPTECGCGYKCIIYSKLQMFECICQDQFELAPNEIDCFQGLQYNVSDQDPLVYEKFKITTIYLDPYAGVLSAFAIVEIVENETAINSFANAESQDVFCFLLLLDSHGEVLLYSNVVRTRTGVLNELAPRSNDVVLNYSDFLDKSYDVFSALLVSNYKCSINSHVLHLNVSYRNMEESISIESFALNLEDVIAVSQLVLEITAYNEEVDEDYKSVGHRSKTVLIASISASILGFFLVVMSVIIAMLGCRCYARKKHVPKVTSPRTDNVYASVFNDGNLISNRIYVQQTSSHSDGSLISNKIYMRQDLSIDADDSLTSNKMYMPPMAISNSLIEHFSSSISVIGSLVADNNSSDSYQNQRVLKSRIWGYSRRNLVYMKELGKGEFGKVLLMEANGIDDIDERFPVAVKTLSSTDPAVVRKFTDEANLMKELSHPNIVSIIAAIFDDVDENNAPLMILEYMPLGDLKEFLQKQRPGVIGWESKLELRHFYDFAKDVANGIAFLSSKSYVHRDIACRNCLVGHSMNIKLADFGMAKKLNEKGIYNAENNALLPVKWVSPESLLFGIFSPASDVWSYGVLLWEIVTYGDVPLSKVSNSDIQAMAERGNLYHPRPPNCPDDIYAIMTSCHQQLSQDRITVEEILCHLSEEHAQEERVSLASSNYSFELNGH